MKTVYVLFIGIALVLGLKFFNASKVERGYTKKSVNLIFSQINKGLYAKSIIR